MFRKHAAFVVAAVEARGALLHRNRHHIVTFFTSADGKAWTKYGVQMEVSGYHQNVGGDFQALRPELYAAGKGRVRFSGFTYRAIVD